MQTRQQTVDGVSTRHQGLAAQMFCCLLLGVISCMASARESGQDCTGRAAVEPGDHTYSVDVGDLKRTYRVHVPPAYLPEIPTPVVMAFHGGWGTGKYMQKQSRMNEVADANGFIGVFPDGLYRTWNAGGCCEKSMRLNIDDVGFVRKMIEMLEKDYCVDSRRIYATGFSNGAMFAHRLACELSDKIAAIAPVSGVIMVSSCQPERDMPVMIFHGTADPRSLWEGGLGDKNAEKGIRDSLPKTVTKLTDRYHCSGAPVVTLQDGAVSCETHEPCRGGAEVTLCRIEGGGHQWPGGEAVWKNKLGPINTDISASAMMWKFFQKHPMPEAAPESSQRVGTVPAPAGISSKGSARDTR